MPSFDIVSEIDQQELTNAVDQANRELKNRFDFKGIEAKFALEKNAIIMTAPSDFQVQQLLEILKAKLIKRSIDIQCLEIKPMTTNLAEAKQEVVAKEGLDKDIAKKIVKFTKDTKLKVQAAIQGESIRVTGKKRDDLQDAIAALKGKEFDMPLQFNNFRD